MRRFGEDELREFLRAVDVHLTTAVRLLVIGGGAVTLGFHVDATTADIDTFQSMTAQLEAAVELARRETGMDVPFGDATVADLPYDFEDRVVEHSFGLEHLHVWTPEIHDLVLSKALRAYENDLAQLRALQGVTNIDLDVLVARFRDEMRHAIGDPRRHKANFLDVVRDLFGELAWLDADRELAGWEKR